MPWDGIDQEAPGSRMEQERIRVPGTQLASLKGMNCERGNEMTEQKAQQAAQEAHRFEKAGLGKAPFRVVGCEEKRGPIDMGGGLTVGAPGQPMGTCDFCGTGIVDCFSIESADHRRFVVGNVCVNKTGDAGLIRVVKSEVARLRTEARHRREAIQIQRLRDLMQDTATRDWLDGQRHPRTDSAFFADQTRLDWAEWMFRNAGNKGKLAILRFIEQTRTVDKEGK